MCTAHTHGVGQLTGQLVHIHLNTLGTGTVNGVHKGAGNQYGVCAKGQRLKYIHTRADAAIHQNLAAAIDGLRNFRQNFCCGGHLVQNAPAVVGNHDRRSTGFHRLLRAACRHDALDDERNLGIRNNAAQLLHRFAAGGRVQVLQKRQTGGVNVHGNGKRAGGTHQGHLFCNRPGIPRLYGWNAKPGIGFYCLAGTHHNRGIGAVTGESQDPGIVAGGNQNIIVLQVGVLGAVMQLHGTHRPGKNRDAVTVAEHFQRGVRLTRFANGVHVHPHVLPCAVIADGNITHALGTGTRHRVAAGTPITHRARFAGPHLATRCSKYFVIRHGRLLLCGGKSRSVYSLPL